MTLEQIKNNYAVSKNFTDWDDLVYDLGYNRTSRLLQFIDEVMKIYAMECLKLASERFGTDYNVNRVLNENNLIK